MSSTIVRVKRRLEESPLEALVLHCKRPRTDSDDLLAPSVFIFSGTVNEVDNTHNIKRSWFRNQDKTHLLDTTIKIPEIIRKLKEEHKSSVYENKIKILNYSRGLSLGSESEGEIENSENKYSVLDLHHSKESSEQKSSISTEQYAYDLYLSQQKDFDVTMLDDIVRIDPYHGDLVFGSYRDNGRKSASEDEADDDEDSNDENNWRNDYPDTDDSIQEEDMRMAMTNCSLEEQLSSDDGEEQLVYGSTAIKDKSAYHNANPDDVDRYGLSYAMYKAKLFKSKNVEIDGEPSLIDSYGEENVTHPKIYEEGSENDTADSYNAESNSENDEY